MGSHVVIEFNEFFAYYGAWLSGVACVVVPALLLVVYKFTRHEEKRP